jgi:hypothetical protein
MRPAGGPGRGGGHGPAASRLRNLKTPTHLSLPQCGPLPVANLNSFKFQLSLGPPGLLRRSESGSRPGLEVQRVRSPMVLPGRDGHAGDSDDAAWCRRLSVSDSDSGVGVRLGISLPVSGSGSGDFTASHSGSGSQAQGWPLSLR